MGTPAKVLTCPALSRSLQVSALKVPHPRYPSIQGKPGRSVTLTQPSRCGWARTQQCLVAGTSYYSMRGGEGGT